MAIVGRPSVGKSTLLNALVGQKISITSKKPQTTRYRITGIATDAHAQFVFVDTPGFQTKHRSRLNDRLNRAVRESLADVDAVVLVLDATRITPADLAVVALLPRDVPVIAAVNKVDTLADKAAFMARLAEIAQAASVRGDRAGVGGEGHAARRRSGPRSRKRCRCPTGCIRRTT